MKRLPIVLVFASFLFSGHPYLLPAAESDGEARGKILDIRGVVLAEENAKGLRRYPRAEETGHLTGYIRAKDGKGLFGLEKTFNESLSAGEDLTLTIDVRMQSIVREAFPSGKKGAVVIMNPNSGAVLAMTSFPEFDPNDSVPAISREKWDAYMNDPNAPMFSRAVHPFVPGSVYKIPAALSAGMAGLEDRTYSCEGGVTFGNKYLKCWISGKQPGKHGKMDLSEAIMNSCNAWFYQLANDAGNDPFEKTARLLGLFESTECGLPNEKSGQSPVEHFQKRGISITDGDRAMMTIGQGTVLATPMQLASMASTVAHGGKRYQAHLVAREKPVLLADLTKSGISPAHIKVVRKAMWRVVNDPDGTVQKVRSKQIAIAGKTGTAATGHPDRPCHAWFIGFAPYEDPKLPVYVFVQNGQSGSRVAGPIARKIILDGLPLLEK